MRKSASSIFVCATDSCDCVTITTVGGPLPLVADNDGRELDLIDAPKPLRAALPKLRKESKALSRKKLGSRNRQRAYARVD